MDLYLNSSVRIRIAGTPSSYNATSFSNFAAVGDNAT